MAPILITHHAKRVRDFYKSITETRYNAYMAIISMEGKYTANLDLAQQYLLTNHYRLKEIRVDGGARILNSTNTQGVGNRNRNGCGGGKPRGTLDRSGNTGFKGELVAHSNEYNTNVWRDMMTQEQVNKVLKLR